MNHLENSVANQVLDRCHSTNDIAKSLGENGSPHGTWISTRIQESGRGRLGRKWESLEGNLFLSIVTRIPDQSLWSWIPLASAVGGVRYLRGLLPGLNFQIKWPNDLLLGNAKIGGILCEGSTLGSNSYVIIGIGMNCNQSPEGLDQLITDLSSGAISLGKGMITADDIRLPIYHSILTELETLTKNGSQRICAAYEDWAAFPPGTEIEWKSQFSQTSLKPNTGNLNTGRIHGLGPSGELHVLTPQGETVSLLAEDIKIHHKFGGTNGSKSQGG